MPKVATFVKAESVRLARKEPRNELAALRKASAGHRRQIAALKREVAALQGKAKMLAKQAGQKVEAQEPQAKVRFSAKGFRSMRAKIGLSAKELATLLDVSQQSVYNWEHEKAAPRQSQIEAIAVLRSLGKKEARRRLEVRAAVSRKPGRLKA